MCQQTFTEPLPPAGPREGTQPFLSGTSSASEANGKAGVLPRHQQQKERKPRSKVLL